MLLDEESSPTAVIDELQHLLSKLNVHEEELARINKYQQLFKVRVQSTVQCSTVQYCTVQSSTVQELAEGLPSGDEAVRGL